MGYVKWQKKNSCTGSPVWLFCVRLVVEYLLLPHFDTQMHFTSAARGIWVGFPFGFGHGESSGSPMHSQTLGLSPLLYLFHFKERTWAWLSPFLALNEADPCEEEQGEHPTPPVLGIACVDFSGPYWCCKENFFSSIFFFCLFSLLVAERACSNTWKEEQSLPSWQLA